MSSIKKFPFLDQSLTPEAGFYMNQLIHINLYGLAWNYNPVVNYSTNDNAARRLLDMMNGVPDTTRTHYIEGSKKMERPIVYDKNVRVTKVYPNGGIANEYYEARYQDAYKENSQTVKANTYALAVSRVFLGLNYSVHHQYLREKNFAGEWKNLNNPLTRPVSVDTTNYPELTSNKSAPGVSYYLNYNYVPKYGSDSPLVTTSTNLPSDPTYYKNWPGISRMYATLGNVGSNRNLKRGRQPSNMNYLKKSLNTPTKNIERKHLKIGDTNAPHFYDGLLAYYNTYEIDNVRRDAPVIGKLMGDSVSDFGEIKYFNSFENSTKVRNNPESNYIRDMSMININSSTNAQGLLMGDSVWGDYYYTQHALKLPRLRIDTMCIDGLVDGDPSTSIPQWAWSKDDNYIHSQLKKVAYQDGYDDDFLNNFADTIFYQPYAEDYNILGKNDFTIDLWYRIHTYPAGVTPATRKFIMGNKAGTNVDPLAGFTVETFKFAGEYFPFIMWNTGDSNDANISNIAQVINAATLDTGEWVYIAFGRKDDMMFFSMGDTTTYYGYDTVSYSTPGKVRDTDITNSAYPVSFGWHEECSTIGQEVSGVDFHKVRYYNRALSPEMLERNYLVEAPQVLHATGTGGKERTGLQFDYFKLKQSTFTKVPKTIVDSAGATQMVTDVIMQLGESVTPW